MTILLTAVVSIISYTHILPILDRLTEYIQALILTQKMRVNVEYTKYEQIVGNMGSNSPTKVIGFQVESEEDDE